MGICTPERLLRVAAGARGNLAYLPFYEHTAVRSFMYAAANSTVSLADAERAVEGIREILSSRYYYTNKGGRLWNLDPTYFADLDQTQPWIGWEFELGYRSRDALREAILYAYDNFEGATFDCEGDGTSAVEITFPPQELSRLSDGTLNSDMFMQWNCANHPRIGYNSGQSYVGTHLNVSTPAMRSAGSHYSMNRVSTFLVNTLRFLMYVNGRRLELLGRETLYGLCFDQGTYMELKWFRSPTTQARWDTYKRVAAAIVKCLLLSETRTTWPVNTGVSNLYEMVMEDAEPVIGVVDTTLMPANAASLSINDRGR